MERSRGGQGFEGEENEFLFLLCAGKAVWVAGLRVVAGETEGPAQLVSGGVST